MIRLEETVAWGWLNLDRSKKSASESCAQHEHWRCSRPALSFGETDCSAEPPLNHSDCSRHTTAQAICSTSRTTFYEFGITYSKNSGIKRCLDCTRYDKKSLGDTSRQAS